MASAVADDKRLCEVAAQETTPGVKIADVMLDVQFLLDEGLNPLDRTGAHSCSFGVSSAELAAQHGNWSFISVLLKRKLLTRDVMGILFYTAIKHGHLELAERLHKEGAIIDGLTNDTVKIGKLNLMTPLLAAINLPEITKEQKERKFAILKYLIDRGANIYAKDADGFMPAYYAYSKFREERYTNKKYADDIYNLFKRPFESSMKGGFSPSVMGAFASSGAHLMPAAAYIGYKMFKNGRRKPARKTRKGSKKARRTRRTR